MFHKIMFRVGLMLALVLGSCGLATSPAFADGTGHSLNVYHQPNNSGKALLVCKDWGGSSSVRNDCPSKTANLPQGNGTKRDLGWDDTDGVRIPAGYSAKFSQVGPDGIIYQNCSGRTKWKKVSPYVLTGSSTLKVYLKKNPSGLGGC